MIIIVIKQDKNLQYIVPITYPVGYHAMTRTADVDIVWVLIMKYS